MFAVFVYQPRWWRLRQTRSLPGAPTTCHRRAAARSISGRCASKAAHSTGSRRGAYYSHPCTPSVCVPFYARPYVHVYMTLPVIASRSSHSIDGCMPVHSHPCIRVYMIPPNCCTRAYTCRCSGDFTQAKQTKYAQALPGLSSRAISEHLPADLTEAERAVAEQPGMYGRIWYGQGLCFDEAYQILQDRGVYTHTPPPVHRILHRCASHLHLTWCTHIQCCLS